MITRPDTGEPGELKWSILSCPTKLLPISLVECKLTGLGRQVSGYGHSLMYRDSLTRAFAEAWERLWVELLGLDGADGASAPHSSNGYASGATPFEAEAAARRELIERAVLLTAWNTRKGWRRMSVTGLMNRVLSAALDAQGWSVALFALDELRLGSVICGLGTRRHGGAIFDSAYLGPDLDGAMAQSKILRSLLAKAVVLERNPSAYSPLPERGSPTSHRDFYTEPANLAAFDFIFDRTSRPEPIELGDYDALVSAVRISVAGFPYVASADHPCWPRLSWGRWSIQKGGNEWPHPLA